MYNIHWTRQPFRNVNDDATTATTLLVKLVDHGYKYTWSFIVVTGCSIIKVKLRAKQKKENGNQ